jgi:hypothetical protein
MDAVKHCYRVNTFDLKRQPQSSLEQDADRLSVITVIPQKPKATEFFCFRQTLGRGVTACNQCVQRDIGD